MSLRVNCIWQLKIRNVCSKSKAILLGVCNKLARNKSIPFEQNYDTPLKSRIFGNFKSLINWDIKWNEVI